MKKILFTIFTLLMCKVLFIVADPALPDSILVHQPDGTILWVYDRGDEYYNWVESTDGYVIIKNTDGIFEYATITDSQIRPSGLKVCNIQNKEVSEKNYAKSQKDVILLKENGTTIAQTKIMV